MTTAASDTERQRVEQFGYLDAVRGIAVVGVVTVHTSQVFGSFGAPYDAWLSAGARGVQLFFIASALTLVHSWNSRQDGAINFYLRRLFRITPLFWLATVGYIALSGVSPRPENLLTSVFFLNGFHPDWLWRGPVPGSWSIAIEMTFYLIFPVLVIVVNSLARSLIFLAATIAFDRLTFRSISSHWQTVLSPESAQNVADTAWLGFHAQMPVFASGFVLYFLIKKLRLTKSSSNALGIAAVAALLAFAARGGRMAEWAVLLSLLVLAMSMGGLPPLQSRPIREIGKVSFAVYIVHFAVLRFTVEPFVRTFGSAPWLFPAMLILAVLLSYLVATLLYNLVEKPGREVGRNFVEWRSGFGSARVPPPK